MKTEARKTLQTYRSKPRGVASALRGKAPGAHEPKLGPRALGFMYGSGFRYWAQGFRVSYCCYLEDTIGRHVGLWMVLMLVAFQVGFVKVGFVGFVDAFSGLV